MVALSLSLSFSSKHTVAAVADDLWALDPSYGRDGVMQFKPSAWTAAINNYRSTVLVDGRLIVALEGQEIYGRGSNPWWGTAVFTSSGALLTKLNLETVGVQSDGKLLVWDYSGDELMRYFPNGERDPSFVALAPAATDRILQLTVAGDDSILYSYGSPYRVAKLQPDGTPDPTFSADVGPFTMLDQIVAHPAGGFVIQERETTEISCSAQFYADDGQFRASFYRDSYGDPDNFCGGTTISFAPHPDGGLVWADRGKTLHRAAADGARNMAFGTDGSARLPLPEGWESVNTYLPIAIAEDGRIVAAGLFDTPRGRKLVLARLTSDGQADQSFGQSGFLALDRDWDSLRQVHLLPDNKVLVVGNDAGELVVARFQATPVVTRIALPLVRAAQ
jgi:uncharacterized delta-60 repeat protein